MSRNHIDRMVDGVREHARKTRGWSFVCDALTDECLAEMVSECVDVPAAVTEVWHRTKNVLVRRSTRNTEYAWAKPDPG